MTAEAQTQTNEQLLAANKRVYVRVAVLLAVITLAEFSILYAHGLKSVMAPALLAMSAVKFGYVAAVFMHLRQDSKVLSGFFYSGLAISVATALGIAAIFVAWYA